jgi:hypothetical protein
VVQPRTTTFQFETKNAASGVYRWVANPQVGRLNHGRDFTLNSGFAVQTDGATSLQNAWRLIQVSGSTLFDELATSILDAFGFSNDHLYEFSFKVIAQRKFPTKPKIMLDRVLREKLIFQLFFCKASKHRQMQVSISHKARSAFQDTTPVHASLSSRIGDSRRQKSTF